MNPQHRQVKQVFPFWRAVEALTPQKLDKDNPNDKLKPAYKIEFGQLLPWNATWHLCKPLPNAKVWHYTVQCGVYHLEPLAKKLELKIGAHPQVIESGRKEKGRLFDISFNDAGIPQPASFMLSLPVWASGQLLQHQQGIVALEHNVPVDLSDLRAPGDTIPMIDSGFAGFDSLVGHLMQWIADEADRMAAAGQKADLSWLITLAEKVLGKTFFPRELMDPQVVCLVKCKQVKAPQPGKDSDAATKNSASRQPKKADAKKRPVAAADDMINSFFIQELSQLAVHWQQGNVGPGLAEYMSAIAEPERARLDIRSPAGLACAFQRLLPSQPPPGAWPSEYPLVFSQQLAVNEIWRRTAGCPGIFAVNGPPGTGKTTLLRDVVAAVITQRAGQLVSLGDQAFAAKKTIKYGDRWLPSYPFHPSLTGSSIVVASANNGAVENISLELPGAEAVPDAVREQSDYFAGLTSELLGKPGWGLLAAKLGNKSNRDEFMNIFWWRKPENKEAGAEVPDSFTPVRGEGLRYHLEKLKEGTRKAAILWNDAVTRFQQAQTRENQQRQQLNHYAKLPERLHKLRDAINKMAADGQALNRQLDKARQDCAAVNREIVQLEQQYQECVNQLQAIETQLQRHQTNKPGVLAWLSTLGRSHREWWERYQRLTQQYDASQQAAEQQQGILAQANINHGDKEQAIAGLERELQQTERLLKQERARLEQAETGYAQAKASLGNYWPDPLASDEEREKSSPWAEEAWRQARTELFLTALDVHRAFIEAHPAEIISNINLASNWLQGKQLPAAEAKLALDSLTFIVPVISTTFASIPRMFKQIGREAIGWLLIDEAGQALPQLAAGAIWRASRTIVVGDPRQLEPVSGISTTVEAALAKYHGVPAIWWPSQVSTQVLADQTMDLGTVSGDPQDGPAWIGCPLRVHRRCDNPMFAIGNALAYDGLMVQGKKATVSSLPDSCWIDVIGQNCEGNWVREEGEAAENLLLILQNYQVQPDEVFLISPFRDGAASLSRLAYRLGFDSRKTGTVHTTQGKEARIVVLVLGGNIANQGAKAWAAEKPNLLNVAVTRAKQRLYVIGNRAQWQSQRYFSTLAQMLPESTLEEISAVCQA